MKNFVTATIMLLAPCLTHAQAGEDHPEFAAIIEVIHAWAKTLETGDLKRRAQLTIDGAMIHRKIEQDDGSFEFRPLTRNIDISEAEPSEQLERFWDEELIIRDNFAVFLANYDFWVAGEFSHCGTDVFDLVKIDGNWKIGNMMYTVQFTNCPPSPLGQP